MKRMTGAEATIRLLERQGIHIIPGIPGGTNLPLYDALSHSEQIRHVLARHEQGAGFMAQGMARTSGTPQVFMATSGPGATNTLTALADAKLDSVPIICITGQVPTSMIGSDAFQEVDIYGMSIPATKHNFLVRSAEELLTVIPEAFRIAASDRPGPVLIDIPKDVQTAMLEFEQWPEPGKPNPLPPFSWDDIEKAAKMINAAQRPFLYIGGGVVQSGASELARALAEKTSIPVATTLMGLGALPSDHPLCLGMLGMHAAPCTNLLLEESDLLIALGVRFDDRATGKADQFCPGAQILHVDIDPGELDKIKTPLLGITADAKQVLESLLPMVEKRPRRQWSERVSRLRHSHPLDLPRADDIMAPYGIIQAVSKLMEDDDIITTDVGQHQMRTAQAYPFRRPGRWLTSGGLGTMGFGLPAAIGASLAEPERTVVCFSGDGSLMMNIQELATAAEHRTNVKIVLTNNNALGLVQQQQELFYGNRLFASDYKHSPDFAAIARGFGLPAVDLDGHPDPEGELKRIFSEQGPCLIHLPVNASDGVYPMVPPGAANREMIGGAEHACI
ncbi:acetolactate synthase large subunit [Desulfovibrio ferrophilus]|uniref:Acetolactate synthase n=1 Tax=Desulfovibrio ferrophilus TaxID=241368 RepID=A0A2Z6AVK5_9BACT|nr:acetolactate synthase large subunit [Desulfovibrio ferrophilus]BBD07250.1 acetolactate synthase catalytic subunit [Desulfovibrio ferrophilus]